MKNNVFYLSAAALEEYLKKYDRGVNTKDYEYHIALHAHAYYEERLKQEFVIAFEVNDKPHNYPPRMEINTEVLRDIITNHFKEATDVDFVLAPRKSAEEGKFGYPFQLKKFIAGEAPITSSGVADYINKKVSHYRNGELSMIVVPANKIDRDVQEGFDIIELKNILKIEDNALYAVFMFQYIDGKVFFRPIWLSSRAKAFKAS